jgi:hypothetical protein
MNIGQACLNGYAHWCDDDRMRFRLSLAGNNESGNPSDGPELTQGTHLISVLLTIVWQ